MKIELAQKQLESEFGTDRILKDVPMSTITYFHIGGPADYYFEAKNNNELLRIVESARKSRINYYILGLGANLLVGDRGIRGLVIKAANNDLEIIGPCVSEAGVDKEKSSAHYRPFDTAKYLRFDDLDMTEPELDTIVRVGAGVSLSYLIGWTLERGLTGLQNFAGIPSTIGGCIYNNVHGGTKLFDQFVDRVVLLDKEGKKIEVSHSKLEFAYDYSRLQKTGEIVVEVYLKLAHGDDVRAKEVREEWLKRKLKVQPQNNCSGCIFKNLTPEEAERIGSPTVSAAWVLDIGLGLKGLRVGGIEISEKHANFFVNTGGATAADVLALIKLVKEKTWQKFNLELHEEIQKVGDF